MPRKKSEYIKDEQGAKQRYVRQVKALKGRKGKIIFDEEFMHEGVREILGDELSQKFIREVHEEIDRNKK